MSLPGCSATSHCASIAVQADNWPDSITHGAELATAEQQAHPQCHCSFRVVHSNIATFFYKRGRVLFVDVVFSVDIEGCPLPDSIATVTCLYVDDSLYQRAVSWYTTHKIRVETLHVTSRLEREECVKLYNVEPVQEQKADVLQPQLVLDFDHTCYMDAATWNRIQKTPRGSVVIEIDDAGLNAHPWAWPTETTTPSQYKSAFFDINTQRLYYKPGALRIPDGRVVLTLPYKKKVAIIAPHMLKSEELMELTD